MKKEKYDIQAAVEDLQRIGIDAHLESFGFSASLKDVTGIINLHCGSESDGGFSMCIQLSDENNQWFVGLEVQNVVELISVAHEQIKNKRKDTWVDALNSAKLNGITRWRSPSS